jgi:hypothetical protein
MAAAGALEHVGGILREEIGPPWQSTDTAGNPGEVKRRFRPGLKTGASTPRS